MDSRTLYVITASLLLTIGGASSAVAQERSERSASPEGLRSDVGTKVDYVLQPQDVVRVHVFQEDAINKQCEALSISKENTITLPLIKTISLKGRTVRQAEEMIRDLFDKDYLVNPQVSVVVLKYAERFVNVIGAVNKPDRVPFPPERGLTILDAISLAGGPNRLADLRRVKLNRKKDDGESNAQEINVDAIMKSGARDAVQLDNDDVVYVPERIL